MKLYAYKNGSASAKALAEALGIKRIKHEGKYIYSDVILNWGASRFKRVCEAGEILNRPWSVHIASNKLETFKTLDGGVSIPQWTELVPEAARWLDEGDTVMCRTVLNGNSGKGIVLATNKDELVPAPLYTRYIKKKEEYRVHIFRDDIIFGQRKARKLDVADADVNWQVRNLAGGFIFAHKDVVLPDNVATQAVLAVRNLALDFGAVDVVLGKDGNAYVLEVNTAPGLEGSTLEAYVKAFKELM